MRTCQARVAAAGWFILVLVALTRCTNAAVYSVRENSPPDTFVADIRVDGDYVNVYGLEDAARLTFELISDSSEIPSFAIADASKGILTTVRAIDRDRMCPNRKQCIQRLRIRVHPIHFFEIIKLDVEILDKNDNPPKFPDSVVKRALKEDSAVGTSFTIPLAEDADSPALSIQSYRLDPLSDVFELKIPALPESDAVDLQLVLRSPLDRETEGSYSLRVVAIDGGSPPQTGSVLVEIDVIDVNDNNPTFEQPRYNVSVLENSLPTRHLLTLVAIDLDSGVNGDVWYQVGPKDVADLFGINDNGELSLLQALDYEQAPSYVLVVEARDRDVNSMPARATVTVHVLDANDNAPVVLVHDSGVSEAAPLGTFVAYMTITDADSGDNGEFECTIDSNHFQLQRLDDTEFKVTTTDLLDRERQAIYELVIACVDKGTGPQTSTTYVTIEVSDENDNGPIFLESTYSGAVVENATPGTWVAHVRATDADIGENAAIVYSIEKRMRAYFEIDPTSGNVTTLKAFDYEKQKQVEVIVTATDKLNSNFSATTKLVLNIIDDNDERPTFVERRYNFKIPENSPNGTLVGRVNATDADSAPYDKFEYSIAARASDDGFVINSTTGELLSARSLDRELKATYTLRVLATDTSETSEGRLQDVCIVTVTLLDVNDNAPIILFPSDVNDTVQVSSYAPRGHVFGRILATDRDDGGSNSLVYTLSADATIPFSIGATEGLLLVSDSLSGIRYRLYSVTVRVRDEMGSGLWTERPLHVIVDSELAYSNANQTDLVPGNNVTIVIVIAVVSAILVIVLIAAIFIFLCRQRPLKTSTVPGAPSPPSGKTTSEICAYDMHQYTQARPTDSSLPATAFTNYAMTMKPEVDYSRNVPNTIPPDDIPVKYYAGHEGLSYCPAYGDEDIQSQCSEDNTTDSGRGSNDGSAEPPAAANKLTNVLNGPGFSPAQPAPLDYWAKIAPHDVTDAFPTTAGECARASSLSLKPVLPPRVPKRHASDTATSRLTPSAGNQSCYDDRFRLTLPCDDSFSDSDAQRRVRLASQV